MPRIELNIKGEAAEALDALQKITKKEQPSDVIVSAQDSQVDS